jgi:hypothetical protein
MPTDPNSAPKDCGPLLMLLPAAEHELEFQALKESLSQDPWHAKREAIEGDSYYRRLHASMPLASFRPRSAASITREARLEAAARVLLSPQQ